MTGLGRVLYCHDNPVTPEVLSAETSSNKYFDSATGSHNFVTTHVVGVKFLPGSSNVAWIVGK